MIALIGISLLLTFLISLLMSVGFWFITPDLAKAVFFMTFAFLWIIMEPVNRLLRIRGVREQAKTFDKLTIYETAVGKQSVTLECEFCGEPNATKILLNEPNSFDCSKCDNENKIAIQFTTVRASNPLEANSVPVVGMDETPDDD